jgi:hypothetical protein
VMLREVSCTNIGCAFFQLQATETGQ